MKSLLPYILMFAGTLLSAVLVMGLLLMTKPDLFGAGQAPDVTASPEPQGIQPVPEPAPAGSEKSEPDSVRPASGGNEGPVPPTVDSLALLRKDLTELRDSLVSASRQAALAVHPPAQADSAVGPSPSVSAADSARTQERRAMAKVFDSMPAENAARILNDLPDSEVKEILLAVKKRQAARILAALDPGRAARIMR